MDFVHNRQDHVHGLRKSNKPLLEKKRRARINKSLDQLKSLVLDALKKDTARYSKLEKADILEMTVKHLRALQRHQMAAAVQVDPSVVGKFRAGFAECLQEVDRYLGTVDGAGTEVRMRLLQHLANCSNNIDHVISPPQTPFQPQNPHNAMSGLPFPMATPISALPGYPPHVTTSGYSGYHSDVLTAHAPATGTWSPNSTDSSPDHKYGFGGLIPSAFKVRGQSPSITSSMDHDSDDVTSDEEDDGKENVNVTSSHLMTSLQYNTSRQDVTSHQYNMNLAGRQENYGAPGHSVQRAIQYNQGIQRAIQYNEGVQVKEEPMWRPW